MTASPFAALHDAVFVLPNAWDVTSARALAAHGFPAVGTTSLGIAAAHGLPDGIEELVAELEVDGVNVEDGRGPGRLAPPAEQAARVAAIKALGAALDIAGRQRDEGALGPVDAPSYASVTALSVPAPGTPGGPR